VALLPSRFQLREVSIERASQLNRFQSQWLISAYERIVPSLHRRSPSHVLPAYSISEATVTINNMKEKP
jgi:hypothetical protein